MTKAELESLLGEAEDLLDDLKSALDADNVAGARRLLNEWFEDEEEPEE